MYLDERALFKMGDAFKLARSRGAATFSRGAPAIPFAIWQGVCKEGACKKGGGLARLEGAPARMEGCWCEGRSAVLRKGRCPQEAAHVRRG